MFSIFISEKQGFYSMKHLGKGEKSQKITFKNL